MTVAGYVDVPLDIFSGLSTDYSAPDLPPGASPDCADIVFELAGAVKTRPGLLSKEGSNQLSGSVNYMKTFEATPGAIANLMLDSSGNLFEELSDGTLTLISSLIRPNSYAKSVSQFEREYIAFSDGKFGVDLARQWDGTHLDLVSQEGPGVSPASVVDITTVVNVTTIAFSNVANISSISEIGNVVTVQTSTPHGLTETAGFVLIYGVATSVAFNGLYQIATIPDTTHFTVINAGVAIAADTTGTVALGLVTVTTSAPHGLSVGDVITLTGSSGTLNNNQNQTSNTPTPPTWDVVAIGTATQFQFSLVGLNTTSIVAGAGGTVQCGGRITDGTHSLAVSFVTRQGYITRPSPIIQWTAAGQKKALVSGIPIGPSNIIARILIFTLAGQGTYFQIPVSGTVPGDSFLFNGGLAPPVVIGTTVISDNTTTTFTANFSDTDLSSFGLSAQQWFTKDVLGEAAGVLAYNTRLFWWGVRNRIQNLLGMAFLSGSTGTPLGWTTISSGGTVVADARYVQAYQITGNGSANVGGIEQSAYQDFLKNAILRLNEAYSLRVQVKTFGAIAQGQLKINLVSVSAGINTAGLVVNFNQANNNSYTEFIGAIGGPFTTIPADLFLVIQAIGTPTNGAGFLLANMSVFPTGTPFRDSDLIGSAASGDPENYDGVTGFIEVDPQDGQRITCATVVRERMRIAKYGQGASLWSTADTGNSEPADWAVTADSLTKGAVSPNAMDVGEDWFVMADRSGLHISDGGEPMKVSQEIQTVPVVSNLTTYWDAINWTAAHTIWLTVDIRVRRVYIGVPIGASTTPNRILVFDYRGLDSVSQIANSPSVHQSQYSGKTFTVAKGRRWVPWFISANSGTTLERFDGTRQLFLGNGAGNNKAYQLTEGQFSDDGVAINGYYTTYAFLDEDQEVQLQLGGHLKIFAYLSCYVEGSGTFNVSAFINNLLGAPITIPSVQLASPSSFDNEWPTNINQASRVFFRFGTNAVGSWFRLQRFTPSVGKDQTMLRGI